MAEILHENIVSENEKMNKGNTKKNMCSYIGTAHTYFGNKQTCTLICEGALR